MQIDIFTITETDLETLLKENESQITFTQNADFTTHKEEFMVRNNFGNIELYKLKHNAYKVCLGWYYVQTFKDIKSLKYTMTHYF